MSNRASVTTFYGICYPPDSEEAARFNDDGESPRHETTPPALLSWGEPRDGVQAVGFGHHDLPGVGLAAAGTVKVGRPWQPLALPSSEPGQEPDGAGTALMSYCEKHGLTYTHPDWWAVPYYG